MTDKKYIEREMLIEEARNNKAVCQSLADIVDIQDIINNVPAANVQPIIHSKWEISSDGYYPYCKNCFKEPQGRVMTDYCPNCGAKMDSNEVE